jgi:hypothetical protein
MSVLPDSSPACPAFAIFPFLSFLSACPPACPPDCPASAIFFPNVVLLSCPSCQTVRLPVLHLRFCLFVVFLSCPSCPPVLLPVLPAYPPCLSSLPVLPLCDFLCKCRPPFLSFLSAWVPACIPCLSCTCYFLCPPFLSFMSVPTACPAFAFSNLMSYDLPVLSEEQFNY